MIEIFDKLYKKIAILENGFNVTEEINKNGLNYLEFSLPADDPKNKFCQSFNFAKHDGGQVYRIMPKITEVSEDDIITYECEHVIATLIDDVMFGYHVVGNLGYYTRGVIEYILSKQEIERWVLGDCDFNRQFEYGWEQENLLSALFSVPRPFTDDYIFEYDTEEFPFTLHLRKIDMEQNPSINIRKQKNTLRISSQSDPKSICTRLYPLGYGEGVNQLNIKNINNGIPYIQSSPDIIEKYGIVQRIWTDRRYENEESLFNAAKAMLSKLENIAVDYEVDFVDVDDFEKAKVGKVARIIDTSSGLDFTTLITSINIDYSDIKQSTISISETGQSIADSVADLADRQRIETTYSQGATQMYAQNLQANADPGNSAEMNFFIPNEMRIINKVLIKLKLESFRAYSRATQGGGGFFESTSSGGGFYSSTSDGGGDFYSTSDGGGDFYSTSDGGGFYSTTEDGGGFHSTTEDGGGIYTSTEENERDYTSTDSGGGTYSSTGRNDRILDTTDEVDMEQVWHLSRPYSYITDMFSLEGEPKHAHRVVPHSHPHKHRVEIPSHAHAIDIDDHSHEIRIDGHSHSLEVEDHNHNVNIDPHGHMLQTDDHNHSVTVHDHNHSVTVHDHNHTLQIDDHSHNLNIKDHDHYVIPGIYRFGNAQSFQLRINNKLIGRFNSINQELDITQYLINQYGNIDRGSWQSIEVIPDDLAYISIDLMLQGFIQSRGNETV